MLGNDEPEASVPGEVLPGREWYDYEAKYTDGIAKLLIPAPLSAGLAAEFRRLAVAAFRAIDAAGLARVDFFLDTDDRIWVNEINTIPGFTALLGLPAALGGERPLLPRARRPPDRARPRAPRPEAAACHPGATGDRAGWRSLALPAGTTRHASRGGP